MTIRPMLAVLFSVLALSVAAARAESTEIPLPFAGLAVLPESHVQRTDQNQGDYAFGKASLLDRALVEHRFTLRNEGASALRITELQPTCHCTSGTLESVAGKKPTFPAGALAVLLPGQEMVVKVRVRLAGHPAGPLSKGVLVFAAGHAGPIAALRAVGEFEPGIDITPASLDFGKLKPGETRTQRVTVTFDPRLTCDGSLPVLRQQNDQGQTAADPAITVVPEANSAKLSPATRTTTYVITMRSAQARDVAAHLFFAPVRASDYKGTVPYDTAMGIFGGVSVPVVGEVSAK